MYEEGCLSGVGGKLGKGNSEGGDGREGASVVCNLRPCCAPPPLNCILQSGVSHVKTFPSFRNPPYMRSALTVVPLQEGEQLG